MRLKVTIGCCNNMAAYFCGFRPMSVTDSEHEHSVLSFDEEILPRRKGAGDYGDGRRQHMYQVVLSWANVAVIDDLGYAFLKGFKSEDMMAVWKQLVVPEEVVSLSLSWTKLWLLLSSGKIICCDTENVPNGASAEHDMYRVVHAKTENHEDVKMRYIASGEVYTIGSLESGQAGQLQLSKGDNPAMSTLLWSPFDLPASVEQISCGKEHCLLLTNEGQVFTFGIGSRGQLGHGSTEDSPSPHVVDHLDGLSVLSVAAGGWHSVALSGIGDMYVWGWNDIGQLGLPCKALLDDRTHDEDPSVRRDFVVVVCEPHLLELPGDVVCVDVSCGSRHTAVVTDKGLLLTAGWNAYGQLGLGHTTSQDNFTLVNSLIVRSLLVERVICGGWATLVWTSPQDKVELDVGNLP